MGKTLHLVDGKTPTLHTLRAKASAMVSMIDQLSIIHGAMLLISHNYVDGNYLDGEEDEVTWAIDTINKCFDCKDLKWVLEWVPTDGDLMVIMLTT